MRQEYVEQIEELQSSLANDQQELRAALDRVKRAVSEPLDVPRRIRESPAPWMFGAALVGLWLGARGDA
jgi:hypothetical protein